MPNHTDIDTDTSNQQKLRSFFKAYFLNSDQKWVAWMLLIGIILSIITLVGLSLMFTWWSSAFWIILMAKDVVPFFISIGKFAGLLTAYVSVHMFKNHLLGKLSINWRDWLTNKVLNDYLGDNDKKSSNYLELTRVNPEITSVGQRIQEDIHKFVSHTLSLGFDLFRAVLTLVTFAGNLWVLGGALSFVLVGINIIIPGYLLWASLLVSIGATIATHLIGKSLVEKNKAAEQAEAEFRTTLGKVADQAEPIALEHAEGFYKVALSNQRETIRTISNQKLNTQSKLIGFQNFYMELTSLLPDLMAAPLYFSGLMELSGLIEASGCFFQVNSSLSSLVTHYSEISNWKTNVQRLDELLQAFHNLETEMPRVNVMGIQLRVSPTMPLEAKQAIQIKGLSLFPPMAKDDPMMRELNMTLEKGEHTFIKGKYGLGKSTLFKAIAGTWKYGEGSIELPAGESLYFLPQKPTLPDNATLKQVLTYPEPETAYTDEHCSDILMAFELAPFTSRLYEKRASWATLSGGQQQIIALTRAVLKEPTRLFLDEATSSLNEKAEKHVYETLKSLLPETTIVSIAHRRTVRQFHSRVVSLKPDEFKHIILKEKNTQEFKQNALQF
ncbi:MAG: ABC transporter ATP-binding protein/permease [Legionella sp.]|nr:ABC transporter ATP-binding protein/permease [Legionella sp.]